ncbi:MAG TPA: DUF350 domain-containing protein [Tepidisphaeraceae bacterium]|nr:DUF350 domain-containing protein [Tepidisphaeraceae bacterium]
MNWTLHSFAQAIAATAAFGTMGILLCVLGFKAFDWITPGINVERELTERHNIAVAIVMAAVILAVGAIVIAAMIA